MRISTGSILQFDVSFNIPVNSSFSKITISDVLAPGLMYFPGATTGAKVYLNGSSTALTAGVTDNSTPLTGATTVSLELDSTIVQKSVVTPVKISIPVKVTNCDALIDAIEAAKIADPTAPLKNVAIIKAFSGTAEVSKTEPKVELVFEKCMMFGFGSSYSVEKVRDKEVYLIGNIPAIGSLGTDELEYVITINADTNLNVDDSDLAANWNVFIGNNMLDKVPGATVTASGQVVTIRFKHDQALKNQTLYYSIKAVTRASVESLVGNTLISTASCDLLYTNGGTTSTVCQAPQYTITTNLTPATPVLTGESKVIV